jgi:transcriptional regulator with XRE-family HTH domain
VSKPPKPLNPTASLRAYFGYEVRRHREAAGWSQEELAEALGYSRQLVGFLESADRVVQEDHAQALSRVFKTDRFLILYGLLLREELPDFFRPFAGKEPDAADIRGFEPLIVPGLLQTPAYARAILSIGQRPDWVERAVAARLERQKILFRDEPDPPRLWIVVDEAAIRRQVGGPEVMREQLGHLLDVAVRYNVEIQVVPSSVGEYAGIEGAFYILSFEEGGDVAYKEAAEGGIMIEQPKEVAKMAIRFNLIRAKALSSDESLKLIREAL